MSTLSNEIAAILSQEQKLILSLSISNEKLLTDVKDLTEDVKMLTGMVDNHETEITSILDQITEPGAPNLTTTVLKPKKKRNPMDASSYAGRHYTSTVKEILPAVLQLVPTGYKNGVSVKQTYEAYQRLPNNIEVSITTIQTALGVLTYKGKIHRARKGPMFLYWVPNEF